MSNGRTFRRQLVDLLGPLDGMEIPGGCDQCDAVQTTTPHANGVWQVTVHHDHDCPIVTEVVE